MHGGDLCKHRNHLALSQTEILRVGVLYRFPLKLEACNEKNFKNSRNECIIKIILLHFGIFVRLREWELLVFGNVYFLLRLRLFDV